ncbi:hypothetical protein BD560DRAFT_402765 [Blakeslea trispora]|nr:hypothetical protein BD560DRAFT_402765 [Blakeslea trispora]
MKPLLRSRTSQIKMTTTAATAKSQLAIELADELLYRSCEPAQLHTDLHNPIEFATAVFDLIFSKQ